MSHAFSLANVPIEASSRGVRIELAQIDMVFDGKQVLQTLSLELRAGEFVAIVGRSGSGKSTLLRILAGLEQPTRGTVLWDGKQVNGIYRGTTVMFQDSRLLPWKTVKENVGLGLSGEWSEAADMVLAQVGLGERKGEWPASLSGGQQQRVALARALVRNPRLLLLDEPLSALDALTRLEMQQLIERIWLERGFTTMLVTHDVTEAIRLADRILLLEEGRIALDVYNPLPRPRRQSDAHFTSLEKEVLERIMKNER